MISNVISIFKECIIWIVAFGLFAFLVNTSIEFMPSSWDLTGLGMFAIIVLFVLFLAGGFKIGSAYSDDLDTHEVKSILYFYQRPTRSIKYGFISEVICLLLFYLIVVLSSYLQL